MQIIKELNNLTRGYLCQGDDYSNLLADNKLLLKVAGLAATVLEVEVLVLVLVEVVVVVVVVLFVAFSLVLARG